MRKLILFVITFMIVLLSAVIIGSAEAAQNNAPAILSFTTPAAVVDRAALKDRRVRVAVSWQTVNRPLIANLYFEQVFADGSTINVELPRLIPWVASSGDGIAAPIEPPDGASQIVLRVSLRDLFGPRVYSERQLTLPIGSSGDPGSDIGSMPTITRFVVGSDLVPHSQLVSGTARIPVEWTAIHRPITANLVFEQVINSGNIINVELPRSSPWVNSVDSGVVAPRLPEANDPVRLRLRLVDVLNGRVYDQRIVTVNVVDDSHPAPASIRLFTTSMTSISVGPLEQGTARVPVSWSVDNRPPDANLAFEQVLSSGAVVNVELPRSNPIVPSNGSGLVAPAAPGGGESAIHLQLRLFDLASGSDYARSDLMIPIVSDTVGSARIDFFATNTQDIHESALKDNMARIPVSWTVVNRPADSNLVFEQRLPPDDRLVNVELPRSNPIVPSSGSGVTSPVWPGEGQNAITLFLRLIDLTTGATLTSAELDVPIIHDEQLAYQTGDVCLQTPYAPGNGTAVGSVGRVLDGISISSLPVRGQPNGDSIGSLPVGARFDVVNGPACWQIQTFVPADQYEFRAWLVLARDSNLEGWVEEYGRRDAGSPFYYYELIPDVVSGPAAEIRSFSASPTTADRGATISLMWEVTNVARVSIQAVRPNGQFGVWFNDLPLSGSLSYRLPEENTQFATFLLSLEDAQGRQVTTQTLTISVRCPFSSTYEGCPLTQISTQAAYQAFQGGYMLWCGDTKQIYVLYGSGTYQVFSDTWTPDQPVDSGERPPSGLILPARGFGKVWAQQSGVRDGLGWAVGDESSYAATIETYVIPRDTKAIYVNTPVGLLVMGQGWEIR